MKAQGRGAIRTAALWVAGLGTTVLAAVLVARYVDTASLRTAWAEMRGDPLGVTVAMVAYALAFVLRGAIWRRVVPGLPLGQAVAAVHVTLLGNHVLPFRLGEPLRAVSVAVRAGVPMGTAIASTVTMRAADILAVAVLGLVLGPGIVVSLLGGWGLALMLAGAGLAGLAGLWWLRRRHRSASPSPEAPAPAMGPLRMPGLVVAAGALGAWILESVLMWQSARWVGAPITPAAAVVATCITVGSQIAALAPAGFGTFEAAGTAALAAAGIPASRALAVTLAVHAITTVYSIGTGAIALFVPRPPMRPSAIAAALSRRRAVLPS